MDQACCADIANLNLGSQGNQKQSPSQLRPLTPHMNPQKIIWDYHNILEDDNAIRSNGQTKLASPDLLAQTPSTELCKRKKTSNEVRDTETQTTLITTAEMCDAATQCTLLSDSVSSNPSSNFYPPPAYASLQHSTTGRQTGCKDAAAESKTHTASSARSGGKQTLQRKETTMTRSQPDIRQKFPTNNSSGIVNLKRFRNPFQDVLNMSDSRGMI